RGDRYRPPIRSAGACPYQAPGPHAEPRSHGEDEDVACEDALPVDDFPDMGDEDDGEQNAGDHQGGFHRVLPRVRGAAVPRTARGLPSTTRRRNTGRTAPARPAQTRAPSEGERTRTTVQPTDARSPG